MISSRIHLPLAAGIALGIAVALGSLAAQAEPSAADRQTARTLLIQGRKKLADGDARGALGDFKAAHALMHVPTTGLDLARAYEALGELVEARATASDVSQIPVGRNEPAAFNQARASAAELTAALEARIPSLLLRIEGAPEDRIVARVDGELIPREAFTQARKLNPGPHEIVVEASGFVTERREIALKDAEVVPVEVHVVLAAIRAAQAPGKTAPAAVAPAREERAPVPVWAWAAGGAGVAALAGSVVFAVDHLAAREKVESDCPDSRCDRRTYDVESMDALRARWNRSLGLSLALGAVGLAGVGVAVGGVVLRPEPKRERSALVPLVAPGLQGVVWRGVF